jgi:hypothetical protein
MPVKNIIPGQQVTKEKLQRAKELRRDMTPAEAILWQELRANKLGVHFRPPPASPKSDHINLESASRLFRVVFGGGAEGGGGRRFLLSQRSAGY